jgi:hypothetical protein
MVPFASLILLSAALDAPNAALDSIFTNDFELPVCPRLQQENSNLSYMPDLSQLITNVDVTKYENIWGRSGAGMPISLFPGVSHNVAILLNRGLFIAAKFTVPTSGMSAGANGYLTHAETNGGPPLTMSISTQCGDFSPASTQCFRQETSSFGILAHWRLPTGSGNGCVLTPGQQYYVNFKLTNPNAVDTINCSRDYCVVSILSNITP